MLVTEFGITTEVNPVQPWNTLSSMDVIDSGRVIEVKLLQSQKAFPNKLFTLLPISTEVKFKQP